MSVLLMALLPLFMVLPLVVLEGERDAGLTIYPSLSEYRIEMPRVLNAAAMTFRVTNVGSVEHNFEIEGEGIEQKFVTNLKPGDNRDLQVYLGPGTYTVYCPVGDHRDQGMVLSVRVGP